MSQHSRLLFDSRLVHASQVFHINDQHYVKSVIKESCSAGVHPELLQ